MADQLLNDGEDENPSDDAQRGETVSMPEDEEMDVEDTADGGAVVRMKNEQDVTDKKAHFANIVDEVDRGMLSAAVVELLDKIERDKDARSKRDKLYEEGLRRTGLGDDAPGGAQFTGANKVVHPMLIEACVDFSARVMKEIFPPSGPVKSKILGTVEPEKLEKARRKTDFMNWQATQQMPELRGELEQLSTQLPLGGGQYLKLMWSPQWNRPTAEFIAIDDIYLPFAATNFYTAERKTHVQYVTKNEFLRRMKAGMYTEVDLGSPDQVEFSRASVANDKIEGREDTSYNEDGLRTIFEIYTHLDFGDGVEPYIISIDKSTRKALSLYRNWEPEDKRRKELDWIVEFAFVPWRGAYPIGLTHMIGGLSGAATGALRALLDSAHIQNIPTLLKLKGGPGGQTLNLQPTEVCEIEGGALVDDIRKLAMPIPFNGPSPTLFQLLGFLVDAGKGVVQTSFEKLSDQNANAPVGTTLALIEQGMVVFSSIHSRLHNSVARVFNILHRINSAYLTEEDIAAMENGLDVKPEDFDGPLDVVPVSDPAIFSEAQRFAQVQAVQQRAAAMPQMYDLRKVEEMFIRNLKLSPEDVLQPQPGQDDVDPVSENVAASMGRPVYVLPKQDHVAHIQTHLAFLKSPMFGMNPAIVKSYLYPMAQHLRDHLLNFYLTQAHEAVQRAEREQLITDSAEQQVKVIIRVQQIIEQQLAQFSKELAQIDQMAQQFAPQPPQMPQDNSMQIAQLNAQVQQMALQQKTQTDQARLQLEQQKAAQNLQMDQQKAQIDAASLADKQQARSEEFQSEQMRQAMENERTATEVNARLQMNSEDNATAMRLAAAEIASGEKVAVSTGTGINPSTR
jgi:hypothetical protein